MLDIDWVALGLLMGSVLLAALYGLAASGHFPAEFRPQTLQRGWGALVLWGTMIATGIAGAVALVLAWRALPWYAIVMSFMSTGYRMIDRIVPRCTSP